MSDSTGKNVIAPNRQNRYITEPLAINEYEAARILGKSVQSLRNDRCHCKGPPYLKLGRSVRYQVKDLLNYMQENRIDPEGAQ